MKATDSPLTLRPKVQEELDQMESLGVISKGDEPILWCTGAKEGWSTSDMH